MIKNRTFMMGLGSGLVIGAVASADVDRSGTTASQTQELTKATGSAEALDMQVVEGSDELLTAEQWEERSLARAASPKEPILQKTGTEQPEAPERPKPEPGEEKKQESPGNESGETENTG